MEAPAKPTTAYERKVADTVVEVLHDFIDHLQTLERLSGETHAFNVRRVYGAIGQIRRMRL